MTGAAIQRRPAAGATIVLRQWGFTMQIARWLHVLGVVVWVGGMFFAHFALRPAVQALPPPQRLPLLLETLTRFLRWVGVAVALILGSGFWLIHGLGGMTAVGAGVHAMTGLGLLMAGIYGAVVVGPLRRLSAEVAVGQWAKAGAAMASIRRLIGTNLLLGVLTISVAVLVR